MGMKLIDIVEEIAEKTGHNLSDNSIVRKINNLQSELFRKYKRIPTTSRMDLENGLSDYPLPCPVTNIIQLLVDGTEYKQKYLHEDAEQFYYYLDGTASLFPVPDKDVTSGLLIFHHKQPEELPTNDMEAEPDLDSDFRMLLVWGISKDVTNNESDRKVFRDEYNALLAEYISATQLPMPDMMVE